MRSNRETCRRRFGRSGTPVPGACLGPLIQGCRRPAINAGQPFIAVSSLAASPRPADADDARAARDASAGALHAAPDAASSQPSQPQHLTASAPGVELRGPTPRSIRQRKARFDARSSPIRLSHACSISWISTSQHCRQQLLPGDETGRGLGAPRATARRLPVAFEERRLPVAFEESGRRRNHNALGLIPFRLEPIALSPVEAAPPLKDPVPRSGWALCLAIIPACTLRTTFTRAAHLPL
jgi:hypothetical protein